ncbi:PAS:GGDEF [Magnetospirillum sp. LM-5]|uniref:PAS-domain containing protein n=1 Tax=Magnetospirillum sp. LM-5 TaxID=2681466 RepID=UPI0013824948|nr:PAS-domain containing protein [Magnetospirillum sp. LM-5]CAA7616390.1 PAS:GGDEF [Magnetospirillum sp. LM-5]
MDQGKPKPERKGEGEDAAPSFHRLAFENSSAAMIGVDADGTVAVANRAACRLIGDDPRGRAFLSLIREQDRPGLDQAIATFLAGAEDVSVLRREANGVIHLLQGDGQGSLPVEVALSRAGQRLLVTVRDIGSRIALRTIIENMPGAVTLFGPDLEMRACNAKLQALLGFPDSLFDGGLPSLETLLRYNAERGEYGPGDVDALVAERLRQARIPEAHVFERRRTDGTTLEIRGAPLPGGGFVTIYTDVTARKQAEEALQAAMAESERVRVHLHSVIEHLPQGVTVVDPGLDIVVWNQAFARLLDIPDTVMPPGEVVPYADAIRFVAERGDYGPGDPEDHVRQRVELARNPSQHRFERVLPTGRIIEVFGRPMSDGGFVTTYTDITDIRASARQLERTLALMDEIISRSVIAVFELDGDARFRFASGIERVLGYEMGEIDGRSLLEFVEPTARPVVMGWLAGDLAPGEKAVAPFRCKGGRQAWLELSGYGVDGGFRGVATDITEKHHQDLKIKTLVERLEQSALHDALTGLANRTKFTQRFDIECDRLVRSGKPMSLLVIDLDHFKAINDTFGHVVGDLVLKETAEVLQGSVRATDLVSRFGGEEFVVLLPETDMEGALTVAESLRGAVADRKIRAPGIAEPISVTGTFGVSSMDRDELLALDDFIDAADRAAYRGKRAGRNRVCAATDDAA